MSASWFLVSVYLIWIFWVQVNSIEQPIKSNSVGPGNMSHCGTPSFNDHLDHCFVVLKHIQQSFLMRRLDVWGNSQYYSARRSSLEIFHFCQKHWTFLEIAGLARDLRHGKQRVAPFYHGSESCFLKQKQSDPTTREQGSPSNLNPASKEMISDSVELWETDVCFLHIQLIGTNVWLPKTHNVPPEVDFESSRSPAKSESWNSPNLHCLAVFPTWQYCLYSLVWWIYEINRFRRLSQALVHFVTDRASLFTDHKISGLPTRAS